MATAEEVAKGLTPSVRDALVAAREGPSVYPGKLVLRIDVTMPVRRKLVELGLVSSRVGHPLLRKGLEVRSFLMGEDRRDG